jgi:hypothetical protein
VSSEDLWKVVGRARFDLDFGGKLKQDFAGTVREGGYKLTPTELSDASVAVDRLLLDPGAGTLPPQMTPPSSAEPEEMHKLRMEQFERMGKLTDYMFETVKNTFRYASLTYKSVTWMNWLTFITGIGLFAFSAIYALYAEAKVYSVLFAGLGVSSFVTSFLLRTPEQTQKALSNLVQTEIAFMNYFDQQVFWEGYANIPRGMPPTPDPANIDKASAALMERARQTIDMLERYVEDAPITVQRSRRARKESTFPAPTISPPTPAKPD